MGTKCLSRPGAARRAGLGAAVLGVALVAGVGGELMAAAQAPASQATPAGARARKYRATSPIVRDQATGQRRMPTEAEVTQLVATLETLTTQVSALADGGRRVAGRKPTSEAGFGGVRAGPGQLTRARMETLCVFTFDEGAQFLGLVPVVE